MNQQQAIHPAMLLIRNHGPIYQIHIYLVCGKIKFIIFSVTFLALFENVGPSYERPPVLRDRFGLAEGAVAQDRGHCIYICSECTIYCLMVQLFNN